MVTRNETSMAEDNHVPGELRCQYFCRKRVCLLKGCERMFRCTHPRTRYCSEACRAAAKRWHGRRAQQRYRRTENGKRRRRAQSRDYRARSKSGRHKPIGCSEGDHNQYNRGLLCSRPGCYVRVIAGRRSPCQKYCCKCCYRAVARVIEREHRWLRRCRDRIRDKLRVLNFDTCKTSSARGG